MPYDTTRVSQPFLHAYDTVTYDTTRKWGSGVKIPAHIVHDDASGSIADVDCFSSFNRMDGTWLVLMRRALTTNDLDDINFNNLAPGDSVLVTIATMDHSNSRHFCSRPFYIVFP